MEGLAGILFVLMVVVLALWLALLPAIIANKKESTNKGFIIGLTIIGLFFFPCWIIALIWAIVDSSSKPQKVILVKEV